MAVVWRGLGGHADGRRTARASGREVLRRRHARRRNTRLQRRTADCRRLARPRRAGASGTRVLLRRQGSPQGPGRGVDVLVLRLIAPGHRAHPLRQRAPYQPLPHPDASGRQDPLALAPLQHLAHQRPRLPAGRLRLQAVRVPVQEGEAEELGLRLRAPGQFPKEGVEGLAEVALRGPHSHLEAHARQVAHLALGELAHLLGKAVLAAVAPVEAAHRQPPGLRHLLGPHLAIATLRHQPRGLTHRHEVQLLQAPHTPPSSPPPGRHTALEGTFLPLRPA
jgi:hypothetical protein